MAVDEGSVGGCRQGNSHLPALGVAGANVAAAAVTESDGTDDVRRDVDQTVNQDFVDLVSSFTAHGVLFVVVGAYALAAHGFPRTTGDIDFFVEPTPTNANRVYRALVDFGAPVASHGVSEGDFARPGNVYQLGLPPRRIDILTSISGVTFAEAVADALEGKLGAAAVRFIGREAMKRNKRAAGRPKDLVDVALLEAAELESA